MKRLITIVITLFVLLGLSYGITNYTHSKFIDYSFSIGLVVTVIIWFFASKGGYFTKNLDRQVQLTTGRKAEQQKYEFSPNVVFFTSVAYTFISFVVMLYQYRSYF